MDEGTAPQGASRAGRWAVWIAAALVAYVLSFAPVLVGVGYYYPAKGRSPDGFVKCLAVFYAPVLLVVNGVPPCQSARESYVRWWGQVLGVPDAYKIRGALHHR